MRRLLILCCALTWSACDDEPTAEPDAAVPDAMGGDMAPEADAAPSEDAATEADATADGAVDVDMAEDPDAAPIEGWVSTICAEADRVGGFDITLADEFTAVQGQVADGVVPLDVSVVDAEDGECTLLRPPSLFCNPGCEVGQTCAGDDLCVAQPGAIDLGPVTVSGLTAEVEMSARAPVFFYTFRGDLPHPGFAEGDPITLDGAGTDGIDPFSLRGGGIAPLVTDLDTVALDPGQPAAVTWAPPGLEGPAQMRIELNIANHGGTPARVECFTADDGAFEIPASLVDRLLELGYSGFPSLALTRRTVDTVDLAPGCVELRVNSTTVLDVSIDGLISCSFDEDCPPDQICRLDLTCGPAGEENP